MTQSSPLTLKQAIQHYLQLGIAITPLKSKEKLPRLKNWTLGITELSEAETVFKADDNLGFVLGEPSNGLVDLDFDWREASMIADQVFADCPAVYRESAGITHRLVLTEMGMKTVQFKINRAQAEELRLSKDDKAVILEVRGTGGQTMMPPSVHPCGDVLQWVCGLPTEFPKLPCAEIIRRANLCTFLAVILRCYPRTNGNRSKICMALAGTLLRSGFNTNEANELVIFVAKLAEDEEAEKRTNAEATLKKLQSNENVTSLPSLCEELGIPLMQEPLRRWLAAASPRAAINAPTVNDACNDSDEVMAELNAKFFVVANEGGLCRIASFDDRLFEKNQRRSVLYTQSRSDFQTRFMHLKVIVGEDSKGKTINCRWDILPAVKIFCID